MKISLSIQNLKCGGCAKTITDKLLDINDVSNVQVDTNLNTVSLNYSQESTLENVKNILSNIGYPIFGEDNTLGKKVKSYVSCAVGKISK
jgi:copper chaperone CopZ